MNHLSKLFTLLCLCSLAGCGGGQSGQTSGTLTTRSYKVTDLGYVNQNAVPTGLNDSGDIAGDINGLQGNNGNAQSVPPPQPAFYRSGHWISLGPQGVNGVATGINNSAQVVGAIVLPGNVQHIVLWKTGGYTDLGTLGGADSNSGGINAKGQVTGTAQLANGQYHPFLYTGGHITDLGLLTGSTECDAHAINSMGQIVGTAIVNQTPHAILWQKGVFTDLAPLVGSNSSALAINDSGQIVGDIQDPVALSVWHVFLVTNGAKQALPNLTGSTACHVAAINNAGQIVGRDDTSQHAVLWQNSVPTDLNTLIPAQSGWVLSRATGINNNGQICGYGALNGQTHAFLLSPQ